MAIFLLRFLMNQKRDISLRGEGEELGEGGTKKGDWGECDVISGLQA